MLKKIPIIAALTVAAQSAALTITPTFVDAEDMVWTDMQKAVVYTAINDWTSRIGNDYHLNFTFSLQDIVGNDILATAGPLISELAVGGTYAPWSPGVNHRVNLNTNRMNSLWFDPTPSTSGDMPSNNYDALSVIRHEIGHSLGFYNVYAENYFTPQQSSFWGRHIIDGVFDPGGLNISMAEVGSSHINQSYGQMMSPSIAPGVRNEITDTDLAMLSLAYGYTIIPEPSTWGAAGLGALAFVGLVRRRRARAVT